jgi:UMF1 family MFS transporter
MSASGPNLDRRAIAAWCAYDWANSAFPTVITTFVFATYFTQSVARDPVSGTAEWGRALAISGLAIAFLSPVLGSVADVTGRRKLWLAIFSAINVVAMALLWYVRPAPEFVSLGLVGIVVSTVAFEVATVFYNALLPDLAPPSHVGRVSGWGWGVGYVGGIVCLAVVLFVFVMAEPPPFGLDRATAEHVRIAGPFSALWYAVFALPLFILVPEPRGTAIRLNQALGRGLADLAATIRALKDHRDITWFLVANMIYSDGLTTLFAFGGIYAAGTFAMSLEEVIAFGIALNVTAGAGALAFAWIDDWIGSRRTVLIGLAALIVVGGLMLVIEEKWMFWALGLLIGVFFGPVQAASRSLVARATPPEHRAQMFGLFALSGRITAFVGPAALGWATALANSQRAGMATILLFFAAGLWLLWRKVADI